MSRTKTPLYREINSILQAINNCRAAGNTEWLSRHEESLSALEGFLPSGSGIDCGTRVERADCKPGKLVFSLSYHHMNENGYYDGWTEHVLKVTPSFDGIDLSFSGRNRNEIKDYLHEIYHHVLTSLVWQDEDGKWYSEM